MTGRGAGFVIVARHGLLYYRDRFRGCIEMLQVRRGESITGAPTCPSCGGVLHGEAICPHCGANTAHKPENPPGPPIFQRNRQRTEPRRRLPIVPILILAALIAAAFWPIKAPPNYAMDLRNFWRKATAPLDEEHAGIAEELAAMRTLCERRVRAAGPDMDVASAVYEITECLAGLPRARAEAESQWKAVEKSKADVEERKEAETASRNQAEIAGEWQKLVTKLQTECLSAALPKVQAAWSRAHLGTLQVSEKGTVPAWQWFYALYLKPWRAEKAGEKARIEAAQKQSTTEVTCATCNGTGLVRCPNCGGMGSVPGTSSTPCAQCGGTGSYKFKGSQRTSSCPFCKGSGQIVKNVMKPCPACEAKGAVACATCGGRGLLLASKQLPQ